jgi:mevalonate kinase
MSTGHIHVVNQIQHMIPLGVAQDVHRWVFVAENIFAKNILQDDPCGIDDAAAAFEGALAFTRVGLDKTKDIMSLITWNGRRRDFIAEYILQDDPCGIDDAITVFGGGLAFTRRGVERINGILESVSV